MLMEKIRVWSVSGVILTGEDRSTRSKPRASATSFATNPTRTDPGLNLSLRGEVEPNRHTDGSTPSPTVRLYTKLQQFKYV
jgi:hypothetical protein